MFLALLVTIAMAGYQEMRTSAWQARLLTPIAREANWRVAPGVSDSIRFPGSGPYDQRLGYAHIPAMVDRLAGNGFRVTEQAVVSPRFSQLMDRGLFPIYHEKDAAGLVVDDVRGAALFAARFPERVYDSLDQIAPLIVRSLLFIENRELLDPARPLRNPVVEWDRLAGSVVELALKTLGSDRNVPGASTLATQIEKFRHSPDGVTGNAREKLRQLASGSVRVYLDGENTLGAQRRIILGYLNTVPLAAIPGHGEVHGLAKGLWVWYGLPHETIDSLLRFEDSGLRPGLRVDTAPVAYPTEEVLTRAGAAYRATLSLLLAHRRPSWYLVRAEGREELKALTDVYLRLMAREGIVSAALRDAALAADLDLRPRAPNPEPTSYVERKAANTIRTALLPLLDVPQLYDLDRYDLRVHSTIDRDVQSALSQRILAMSDPAFVRQEGFAQGRLLARGDPAKVVYSFILYERTGTGNVVRVQTDNYDQPLDLNTSGRMELGSTAKLRTLVSYLSIIAERHATLRARGGTGVDSTGTAVIDPLTRWTAAFLRSTPDASLESTLQAAMDRRYSANPAERFVTGGGVHTFNNFDRVHDNQVITVREAFRHSVNLPFIRMMRDIEQYYLYRTPGTKAHILDNPSDPRRAEYLSRFADEEGTLFVTRFARELRGLSRDSVLARVAMNVQPTLSRLTWAFRTVVPDASAEELAQFLVAHPPRQAATRAQVADAFRRSDPSQYNLADQGYLARIHPLQLWVARYVVAHPEATTPELVAASAQARQDVYQWLFSTRRRDAQNRRIRSLLEVEAFMELAEDWKRLGYPFNNLTPSLATAIGSSGDRPASLAELVGILVNDGMRYQVTRVRELVFADSTPFETRLVRQPASGTRVLAPEVARVARAAMLDVVAAGTARRVAGAITLPDGSAVPIGGKTGTGDNRASVTDARGRVVSSRVLSRTSTFVFFFGDRFYGVMTAFVRGADAGDFDFTSALPAQLVRSMGPDLSRLSGISLMSERQDPTPGNDPARTLPGVEGAVTVGTGTGGELPPADTSPP